LSQSVTATFLGAWTVVGILWWIGAAVLVARANARPVRSDTVDNRTRISIFKPIPSPLGEREFAIIRDCLESFVADLDTESELLIGADEPERAQIETFITQMRTEHPSARIELLVESLGDVKMHPKVAWNRKLSRLATGEWWLWSDADIRIPTGTIRSLRADMDAWPGIVTSPYVVANVNTQADMLDALFVNLELYPGVELLGRLNGLRGGLGAGMLFRSDRFEQRVDWDELGSFLAEDFVLGSRLAPLRLASTRLSTVPAATGWGAALLHYLRWQKTIRWCQPGGFASQAVVMPVIGWLAWLLVEPTQTPAWIGFGTVLLADTLAAGAICTLVGCRIRLRHAVVLPLWSLLRGITWLACWLPWPVVWRGRYWWSRRLYDPDRYSASSGEALK
jgi:ceramide glucosyltransferase